MFKKVCAGIPIVYRGLRKHYKLHFVFVSFEGFKFYVTKKLQLPQLDEMNEQTAKSSWGRKFHYLDLTEIEYSALYTVYTASWCGAQQI